MKLEFPRTLEEILMWKLVNAGITDTYASILWDRYRAESSGNDIDNQVFTWLRSIVHISGIVTYQTARSAVQGGEWVSQYRVLVAGITVMHVTDSGLFELYQPLETNTAR